MRLYYPIDTSWLILSLILSQLSAALRISFLGWSLIRTVYHRAHFTLERCTRVFRLSNGNFTRILRPPLNFFTKFKK